MRRPLSIPGVYERTTARRVSKKNTKVQHPVLHSLVNNGVTASLTDDEISPLHNHNRDEEGGMACVFKDFTVMVSPFLSIRIFKIIDRFTVPSLPESKAIWWQEAIFSQNNKVGEESCTSLDKTNLTIGHRYKPLIHQLVGERVAGLALHNI